MSGSSRKKICRICLRQQQSKSLSIFSTLESTSILYAIENISDLKDLRFDNFTKLVCHQCAENVVSAYKTKIQCLASDAFLRGCADSQNNSESELDHDQVTELEPDDEKQRMNKMEEGPHIKVEQYTDPILVIEPHVGEFEDNGVESEDNVVEFADNLVESEIEENNIVDDKIKEESTHYDDYIMDEKEILIPADSSDPEESAAEDEEYEEVDVDLNTTPTDSKSSRKPHKNSLYLRSCCQCEDTFETEADLIAHFKATHAQCVKQHIKLLPNDASQAQCRTQCILCHKLVRQIHTHRRRKHFKDYQDEAAVHGRKQNKLYLRSCCQCPKLFTDEKEVIAHFAAAHAERVKHNLKLLPTTGKQKQCVLCFKLVRNIHTHRRRMHSKDYQARVDQDGDWAFKCETCDIRFTTHKKLDTHNKYNHSGSTNFTPHFQEITSCPICKLETNSPCLLDKHLLKEHPGSKCIECKVCKKMLKLATSLRKHLMTHTGDAVFDCDKCREMFLTLDDLEEHKLLHSNDPVESKTGEDVHKASRVIKNEIIIDNSRYNDKGSKKNREKVPTKQHFCCKCKNTYDDEKELYEHFNETHPDKVRFQYDDVFSKAEDQTQCTLCLGYVKDMYRHRRNKHDRGTYQPKRDYQCTNCGKVYRTDRGMKDCERKHLGLPAERVQCPQCPVTLANRMNLLGHMKLHSKLFRYECDLCGRQFKKGTNLKKHLQSTHSDEKNVRCEVCGKAMKTKSSLSMHMRIHTGERPYQCKYCSNTYMHPTDCKRHEMIHTGYRPYTCDICDKGFIKRSSLVEHQKHHVEDF